MLLLSRSSRSSLVNPDSGGHIRDVVAEKISACSRLGNPDRGERSEMLLRKSHQLFSDWSISDSADTSEMLLLSRSSRSSLVNLDIASR